MAQVLYGSLNRNFENHAPGRVFLFPYPVSNPGIDLPSAVKAYLAYLYGTDLTYTVPSTSTSASGTVTTGGVLTINTTAVGQFGVGQQILMAGLPPYCVIQSKLSGTLGASTSTYQLSVAPTATLTTLPFSTALQPWGDVDENGLQFKIATDTLTFAHNDGSVPSQLVAGIKSADATFSIYDVDANHWADIFGCQAADIMNIAADATHSQSTSALLAFPNTVQKWVVIVQMQSATFGYSDFLILFRTSFIGDPDIKYSQKDKISMKLKLACNPDLYLSNAAGVPAFGCVVTTTGAHT